MIKNNCHIFYSGMCKSYTVKHFGKHSCHLRYNLDWEEVLEEVGYWGLFDEAQKEDDEYYVHSFN